MRRLTSLKGFAKWAGWGEVLDDYIAPTTDRSMPHPLPNGIHDVRRLIAVCRTIEQQALIALGGFMGLRVGECISVTTDDFDLDRMLLTVRGKGDRTRHVPISPEAWENLFVAFTTALGSEDKRIVGLSDAGARQCVVRLGRKAKIKRPIKSHDLRSTFATEALNNTENIRVVQELLGHASTTTTEIYTAVRTDQMRAAVAFDRETE